jgi:hypothetical protein
MRTGACASASVHMVTIVAEQEHYIKRKEHIHQRRRAGHGSKLPAPIIEHDIRNNGRRHKVYRGNVFQLQSYLSFIIVHVVDVIFIGDY